MSRIKPIEFEEAPLEVQRIYRQQEARAGRVLTTTKVRAHCPHLLAPLMEMIRATEEDPLCPADLRTLVNIRVSQMNGCRH
jgi:hypothetical protein